MKYLKILLISLSVFFTGTSLSGCSNNAHVSGSVSYGMSTGGYPMYYGSGYRRSSTMVVVRPRPRAQPRPRRR